MAGYLPIALSLMLGGLILLVFVLKFFTSFRNDQNPASKLPRGNMGWPFIGETLAYLKPHKSNSTGTFLQDHCSRYGRVFKSHLFGSPTIVSCDLELNIYILQNEEKLFQSSYPKAIHDILGKFSLMLVSGDLHKRLRSVAVSFINASKSRPDFHRNIEKMTISFIQSWAEKKQVLFCKEAKRFTFFVMLKNLLNIEAEDPLAVKIQEDFLTFMKGFVSLPLYIPGTAYAKAVKARARISWTLKEIIKEREKRNNNEEVEGVGHGKGDFLEEIMEKSSLNDEEKVSILLDLLLAGYETTSGLLALLLYFLAHAPLALQTLKEEHQAIRRKKKDGDLLTWEDYKQMEFTSHVIFEAMRCGNLVKFVHRKALREVKFKEYVIPAGWKVLPILSAVHLDPSLHEHPSEFNPWRWNDRSTCRKVTPFGGGVRLCPGVEIGKLETAFFLHHFVLNFRWRTKEDECPMLYPYLEFKKGLPLEIERLDTRIDYMPH